MIKRSISNPNMLKVIDVNSQTAYYGCDQEWYATEWQRCAGCGPSVVSTMLLYLDRVSSLSKYGVNTKADCLSLMEEVWQYVTPTDHGIPTTKLLYEDVLQYGEAKALTIEYYVCDMPEEPSARPAFPELLRFIAGALHQDIPVAFLNLCNGDEQNLDCWHWVTIIGLEYDESGASALVTIVDEGVLKKIDLALWYKTTTQGGGFLYFTASSMVNSGVRQMQSV
ncbi:MAG TPA: hypothetical protein VHR47_12225 [Bacillota bacterium]|nr:hypothetical protein [Bacillota bacterium]